MQASSNEQRRRNIDPNWHEFDPDKYIEDSYAAEIIPEDRIITEGFIRAVLTHPELIGRIGMIRHALEVGVGGVLRTAGLISPLLHRDGRLLLTDIGEPQLAATSAVIAGAGRGELGVWATHQTDMERHHPLWEKAIERACRQSTVCHLDIFELPRGRFDLIATSFGPESLTEDPDEYTRAVHCWLDAAKRRAVVVMSYVQGSTGYRTGDTLFPATYVQPEDVENVLRPRVQILEHFVIPSSNTMRNPLDPTSYEGLGMVIGIVA